MLQPRGMACHAAGSKATRAHEGTEGCMLKSSSHIPLHVSGGKNLPTNVTFL